MEEIVRRLISISRKNSSNYIKESLMTISEAEDDPNDTLDPEAEDEDNFEEEEETPTEASSEEEDEESKEEDEVEEPKNPNPLGNPYAVKFSLGDEVVLAHTSGENSKLKGFIEGYDKEGFYRIKWDDASITNGITDIALADLIGSAESCECVCGSTNFVNENKKIICDKCGRIMKEGLDQLTLADKSRPKGKKLVRSEAHPVSTVMKPDFSESIKKAFSRSKKIQEDIDEDIDIFDRLKNSLEGEFWTRTSEIIDDIKAEGYDVLEANSEYFIVAIEDEEGEDHQMQIPLGGTSRTMTLDFSRAREV